MWTYFGAGLSIFVLMVGFVGLADKKEPINHRRNFFMVTAIVALLPVWFGYHLDHKPRPAYQATVINFTVLPNNYVRAYLSVTNVGKAPGSPFCTVTIQPTNAYGDPIGGSGYTWMPANEPTLQPGAALSAHLDIVVSNNDAHLVTSKSMIKVTDC